MVDMAHFAGLVAGGAHPSPLPHAHVVTTTTHKTLRGPRGGMILCNDADIAQADQFGRLSRPAGRAADACHRRQGRRLRRGAAAELSPRYARAVVDNAQTLADDTRRGRAGDRLRRHRYPSDAGRSAALGLTGRDAEQALERAGITCNKNGIPFDPQRPTVTSGIRLGSPAATTRGFGDAEFRQVGEWIVEVLRGLAQNPANNGESRQRVRQEGPARCAPVSDLSRRGR